MGASAVVAVDNSADDTGDTAMVKDGTTNVITLGGQSENTVITVTVTAEDGSTNTYTVTVYRENVVLSDNATLATLALTAGTLVPFGPTGTNVDDSAVDFAPGTTEYTARVLSDNAAGEAVTVTWTSADTLGAQVDIKPADQNSLIGDSQVYLTAGENTVITVTVTAEDGSTNTYTVTVYRERATPSSDATLSALSLSGAGLEPVFDPERTEYTATAAYDTDNNHGNGYCQRYWGFGSSHRFRRSRRPSGGKPGDPFH